MEEWMKETGPLCAGLGEVLFDLLPGGARLGGAPANFAYAARALGLPAVLVSAVGEDELGREARRQLREKGLPAYLPAVRRATGHVHVTLDGRGVPAYAFADEPAYEAIPWTDELEALARRTTLCCFGTLAQWGRTTRRTAERFLRAMPEGSFRVYDVNLRGHFYNRAIVEASIAQADAVKCNEEELPVLCGYAGIDPSPEAYRAYLRSRGVDCFLYTEGAKRSTVYRGEERSVLPTPDGPVEDTVGAGDAFTAAMMAALVRGAPLGRAHALAVEVSSFVCTCRGAMPAYPPAYRERLDAWARA